MLDLLELEQLAAFAEYGTLSKAAQELHISQPTLTRTMKRLEEEFGVPLFVRGKNKIELNETGAEAAACDKAYACTGGAYAAAGSSVSCEASHHCSRVMCACAPLGVSAAFVRRLSGADRLVLSGR